MTAHTRVVTGALFMEYAGALCILLQTFATTQSPLIIKLFEKPSCAARKRWTYGPVYRNVFKRIEEIQRNERPRSDLVVLDDEYSFASRQLWEFAIVDYVSWETLINTRVNYENVLNHTWLRMGEWKRFQLEWLRERGPSGGLPCT